MKYYLISAFILGALTYQMSCTMPERAIIKSVIDIIDTVCGEKDTVDECLSKVNKLRAEQRKAEAMKSYDTQVGAAGGGAK